MHVSCQHKLRSIMWVLCRLCISKISRLACLHVLRVPAGLQVSKEAGEAATGAKGSYGTGIGEEWMAWLPVAWAIRELIEAMDAGGQPAPNSVRQRPDGQVVVDVFPLG